MIKNSSNPVRKGGPLFSNHPVRFLRITLVEFLCHNSKGGRSTITLFDNIYHEETLGIKSLLIKFFDGLFL